MSSAREYAFVMEGKLKRYALPNWRRSEDVHYMAKLALKRIHIPTLTHEISERSDGQWEVMDKTLKVKLYPDKDTMLTALALQGVNIDES